MLGKFDQLYQPAIRGASTDFVARFKKKVSVSVVEFEAVAMALVHHLFSVKPLRQGVCRDPAGVDAQTHCASKVNNILLFGQEMDHRMGGSWLELSARGISEPCQIASPLDDGALHP